MIQYIFRVRIASRFPMQRQPAKIQKKIPFQEDQQTSGILAFFVREFVKIVFLVNSWTHKHYYTKLWSFSFLRRSWKLKILFVNPWMDLLTKNTDHNKKLPLNDCFIFLLSTFLIFFFDSALINLFSIEGDKTLKRLLFHVILSIFLAIFKSFFELLVLMVVSVFHMLRILIMNLVLIFGFLIMNLVLIFGSSLGVDDNEVWH